jgi:hypothetical protein
MDGVESSGGTVGGGRKGQVGAVDVAVWCGSVILSSPVPNGVTAVSPIDGEGSSDDARAHISVTQLGGEPVSQQ